MFLSLPLPRSCSFLSPSLPPSLPPSSLFLRCLLDSDDEVRDRSLLYIEVLKQNQKALSSAYILNRECIIYYTVQFKTIIIICLALNVSVVGLERALLNYCSEPNEDPFDIKTVPIETAPTMDAPKCKCTCTYR